MSEIWNTEYEKGIIPGSTRTTPSKALLLYDQIVDYSKITIALDAGCGNGRNSLYLAKKGIAVCAIDQSSSAINLANKNKQNYRIYFENAKLEDGLPYTSNYFSMMLDSYVMCHFLDKDFRENYLKDAFRVLKPKGLIYSVVFDSNDEYYKGIGIKNQIVTDPSNGITKYIFEEQEFKSLFKDFKEMYFIKFTFDDIVLGKKYKRSVMTTIQKKEM